MNGERTVWQGLKKTRQRERVYEILTQAHHPMSVSDIYQEILRQDGCCGYAVSTVYRVLQAFEAKELVSRTTLPGTDTSVYEWTEGTHCHYAICLKCHKRIPLRECPIRRMDLQDEGETFQITGHKVEVYGYCSGCGEKKQ